MSLSFHKVFSQNSQFKINCHKILNIKDANSEPKTWTYRARTTLWSWSPWCRRWWGRWSFCFLFICSSKNCGASSVSRRYYISSTEMIKLWDNPNNLNYINYSLVNFFTALVMQMECSDVVSLNFANFGLACLIFALCL